MMLRLLLIISIGFTTIFASPVDRERTWSWESSESSEEKHFVSPKLQSMRETFGRSFNQIGDTILRSLNGVFESIEERLDSKKLRKSVDELREVTDVIFNDKHKLRGDYKTRKTVEKQLSEVNRTFGRMLEEAIQNMKRHNHRSVDATHFQFAVNRLKKSVDKLYH